MIDINRILCPIDFSAFSDHALIYAMKMAKWYGAQLRVLHVMPPLPASSTSELAGTSRQLTVKNLKSAIERHRLPAVDVVADLIESAEPVSRILEAAEAYDVDLIVTGSHGRSGVQRVLLGSVVEALLHRSGRPVLTIPSHVDPDRLAAGASFRRIICAIDFSKASLEALAHAFSIAEEADGKLTLLHVIEMPPELAHPPEPPDYDVAPIRAEAEAERLTRLHALIPEHARDYCTVQTEVLEGGASRQILREADVQHTDLIVLGVHGRNAFDLAFFGSNSKDVIRQAHCPVLVVPAGRRSRSLRVAS
jgi:nucleotide-binding universal stress UspA family protein